MNTEEAVALLAQGAAAWNRWRADHPGERPDLSRTSLRSLDLTGADLADLDLRNADLRGTVLTNATLAGARLNGANLFKAVVANANLKAADLRRAQFLNCGQLTAARNWEAALRDEDLACGKPLPGASGQATDYPIDE